MQHRLKLRCNLHWRSSSFFLVFGWWHHHQGELPPPAGLEGVPTLSSCPEMYRRVQLQTDSVLISLLLVFCFEGWKYPFKQLSVVVFYTLFGVECVPNRCQDKFNLHPSFPTFHLTSTSSCCSRLPSFPGCLWTGTAHPFPIFQYY